ncbi:MAG: hypothetical protein JWO05_3777 [Gemmatimonadetes bacterium]|nr:hypothetical protein [Gemmatimonadota bacterium]
MRVNATALRAALLLAACAPIAAAQDTVATPVPALAPAPKPATKPATPAPVWPVAGPAPLPGSLFPAKRVVAFYGNPLSKKMGALGEHPVDEMLRRLDVEVEKWRKADPETPVQPALHLIAVVAQADPGRDGKYRLRADSALVEKVHGWARQHDALLFLDVQVGGSTMQEELPRLMKFLERPDVHLGVDPEFSMHHAREGKKPGTVIGQMDAKTINWVSRQLATLVDAKQLPPKVLVVHRFTKTMLLRPRDIALDPRVQVVVDMDGWGAPWLKRHSYKAYVYQEPVQFAGFKLFFHNDTKKGNAMMTPAEVLALKPRPVYIQYQ